MITPHVPGWVKDAVFYQIFPDRFASSPRVAKPRNLEPWDSPPTVYGYKGGDLLGVVEHLDYLQDLGITAIYFTPIFQSASNHRYHTHDYYQIDPLLGGMPAWRELRRETARRGMKIVLDGVFNHASRGNFFFNDILENGASSPWIDWFMIADFPLNAYDLARPANYEAWANLRALPRWNTENPEVREYLMGIGEYWVREGIDGWRLDVPFEITAPGFWHEFRDRVKAINPETYIVGEVWWDSRNFLRGDQFDGVMNYLFTEPVIQFAGQDHIRYDLIRARAINPYPGIDANHYADRIEQLLGMYAWETSLGQLNLLDSHDTARFRSIVQNDEAAVELATLLLLTFPGAPSIYYGNEIGLEGEQDPDCRRTFPWNQPDQWNQTALAYHRALIALRHAHPALRTGTYRRIYPQPGVTSATARAVYVFLREETDPARQVSDALLVALNISTATQRVALSAEAIGPASAHLTHVVYGPPGGPVPVPDVLLRHEDTIELTLPPRTGWVIGRA